MDNKYIFDGSKGTATLLVIELSHLGDTLQYRKAQQLPAYKRAMAAHPFHLPAPFHNSLPSSETAQ